MESTHETTISPKDQARLNKAEGQWKSLVKDYEDISNEKQYILWTKPFLEFDIADRKNKIRAKCVACNAEYCAESNNLKKNHPNCAQSKLNYNAYVASRRVIDESRLQEDEIELLKMEISELKEEAQRKDDKITDLENQLKQARALIGNQIDPYHLYDHRKKQPGIARIFQMNFKDEQDFMEMSFRDNEYFKKTLDKFGFDTEIRLCDDSADLLKELEALTANQSLPSYQSLVIVINSHGSCDSICGLQMQLIKNAMISCKGMKEQPKVLITGSCQLYKGNPAVTNAKELTTPNSSADFLDIRSCSPGEVATFTKENKECANDFFRYFCKSLEKFHMLGISRVVQEAHQKLLEYNMYVKGRSRRQAPEIRSTLRAELFLKSV